ncbi:MAG TPA: NADH-quinone oxidoreductase subunit J [Gemmataceae bacterium]|nr:NADH-quinone oxidoreductase subunit J [Gemmataceae bacterium]
MELQIYIFWVLAGLTGLCAIATVVTQNSVRSATWLLFTLAGTSAIFFLLGADLVGAIQLLVYVGGTMVLVVFGVMLTAQGPFINMKTSGAEWAISMFAGIALFSVLCFGTLAYNEAKPKAVDVAGGVAASVAAEAKLQPQNPSDSHNSVTIGQALMGSGLGPMHQRAGQVTATHYLLPFEIVSVHLLVVLIGAAYLARAKKRKGVAA